MIAKLARFIPLAITISGISGLIYLTVQQNFRMNANDPQIQMSQDLANSISGGAGSSGVVPPGDIDIGKSLSPYVIIFDSSGKVLSGNAKLDGKTPSVPKGVLDYAMAHGEDRVTWQPKVGVRSAVVATKFTTSKTSGVVVVGRSLTEVEKRVDKLGFQVEMGWLATMFTSFLANLLL